jgi:hypothetical protein
MSSVLAPLGLVAVRTGLTGAAPATIEITNGIQSGYATNLFIGAPVAMSGGYLVAATGAEDIWGVFAGCSYYPTGSIIAYDGYWPASTVLNTQVPLQAWVWQDPEIIYRIQANGSLTQASLGTTYDFAAGTFTNGDTYSGNSQCALSTTAATNPGIVSQFQVLNLWDDQNNAWGDAYTWVEGKISRLQTVADKILGTS